MGPASDIYSLGASLYVLLTGRLPFQGREFHQILAGTIRGDFPPPGQANRLVHPGLEAVCLKAMARERRRPVSHGPGAGRRPRAMAGRRAGHGLARAPIGPGPPLGQGPPDAGDLGLGGPPDGDPGRGLRPLLRGAPPDRATGQGRGMGPDAGPGRHRRAAAAPRAVAPRRPLDRPDPRPTDRRPRGRPQGQSPLRPGAGPARPVEARRPARAALPGDARRRPRPAPGDPRRPEGAVERC